MKAARLLSQAEEENHCLWLDFKGALQVSAIGRARPYISVKDQLEAVRNSKLPKDRTGVAAHRRRADGQTRCYLLVFVSLANERDDLALSPG
jgi:hypothetical protein